jgi:enediyne core biosynthesis thioesterase
MEHEAAGVERRRFPRLDNALPLKLKLDGLEDFEGVSRNISAGGVLLELAPRTGELPALIWPNTRTKLLIQLPGTDQPLEASADITWARKNGTLDGRNGIELGIRFESMEQVHQEALAEFLGPNLPSPPKTFIYEKTVYISDTNVEGNVYFARYFEWQGEAREELFRRFFPVSLIEAGFKLITVNASSEFKNSAYLYDEIMIEVFMSNIKRLSVQLNFKLTNKKTRKLIALGSQKIALANAQGEIIQIPEYLLAIADSLRLE